MEWIRPMGVVKADELKLELAKLQSEHQKHENILGVVEACCRADLPKFAANALARWRKKYSKLPSSELSRYYLAKTALARRQSEILRRKPQDRFYLSKI